MSTLFISDLHLDETRPQIARLLGRFLQQEARQASRLFILGDLFEAWVGDDAPSRLAAEVAKQLAAVSTTGVEIGFIHGNRDFLLGQEYAQRAGMRLLTEPTVIDLDGRRALLVHGDAQCTDDGDYQAFRSTVRDPAWQRAFLSKPIEARLAFAAQARAGSQQHTAATAMDIMDVNDSAIDQLMIAHDVDLLIHGHTHRPAIHQLTLNNGRSAQRIVLGDWYEQGSVLRWNDGKPMLDTPVPLAGIRRLGAQFCA